MQVHVATWRPRRVHPLTDAVVLSSITASHYRPVLNSYWEIVNQRRLAVWRVSCYQSIPDCEASRLWPRGRLPSSDA